jgi:hypothetical protein
MPLLCWLKDTPTNFCPPIQYTAFRQFFEEGCEVPEVARQPVKTIDDQLAAKRLISRLSARTD